MISLKGKKGAKVSQSRTAILAAVDSAREKGHSVAAACKLSKISPSQYYQWRKTDTVAKDLAETATNTDCVSPITLTTTRDGTCIAVRCRVTDLSQVIQAIQ